jgi:hypothetical protein
MTVNKTAWVQHDTPTKNRFIGAMEATGKLRQSAAKYGIKLVFESLVRSGYWVPRGSNRDRDRLSFVPKPKIT